MPTPESQSDTGGRTIIKLGAVGCVHGVDIDTANFNGNESPASDVWGANVPAGESISEDSPLVSSSLFP